MKKREIIELKIEGIEFGGEAFGYHEDRKIYVKNAISGQILKVMIKKIRKDKIEAKMLSVVEKSPIETNTTCAHYGICGGCSMLSVDYKKQAEIKKEQLQKLFREHNHTELCNIEIKSSPDYLEYKNKMEFTFGNETKDAPLSLGMHMKTKSNSIITTDTCIIVDEDYRKIIKATVSFFQNENLPFYRVMSHDGFLRNLVVRKGKNTGEILINIVTTSQIDYNFDNYKNTLLNLDLDGKIIGILNTINDSFSDAVICDELKIIYGTEFFYDTLLDYKFKVSPFSFFQTNTKCAEVLYQEVLNLLEGYEEKTLFDLYSGTGTIGILSSKKVGKVIGVEIIEEAVSMANENCKLNNVSNAKYFACDVKDILSVVNEKPDVIILDPPRAGMHPKAIEDVLSFNSKEIIYVSCNPKAFAKELNKFKQNGYFVKNIIAVDQFPNTPHVETIALLQKQ